MESIFKRMDPVTAEITPVEPLPQLMVGLTLRVNALSLAIWS